jgi:hypothetical protein
MRTRNLWPGILCHYLANWLPLILVVQFGLNGNHQSEGALIGVCHRGHVGKLDGGQKHDARGCYPPSMLSMAWCAWLLEIPKE